MIYQNILSTIGHTPMVKLNNYIKNNFLYAKLEGQNPGGSIKDRAALNMVEQAEKRGQLTKSKIILEASSGNTGIALAMIAAVKGYQAKIILAKNTGIERQKIIKLFGAKLVFSPAKQGTQGALKLAQNIYQQNPNKYWLANQFDNPNNSLAHFHFTAKELIKDLRPDYVIASLGTSGTFMGLAMKLRQAMPQTRLIGVIPPHGYVIPGIKNPHLDGIGKIFQPQLIDQEILINQFQAKLAAQKIAATNGILVGLSAGAALAAAKILDKRLSKQKIVVIIPDRGEKYLKSF